MTGMSVVVRFLLTDSLVTSQSDSSIWSDGSRDDASGFLMESLLCSIMTALGDDWNGSSIEGTEEYLSSLLGGNTT